MIDEEIKINFVFLKIVILFFCVKKNNATIDLLEDLSHTKHFIHTARLESYHNTRLKYMP